MKNSYLYIIFFTLLFLTTSNISAQSFWKKLGKNIEKAGKEVLEKALEPEEIATQEEQETDAQVQQETQSETNESVAPAPLAERNLNGLTDWDVMGLKGRVRSIKYSTGKLINFRPDGFHTYDRQFITTKKFQVGGRDGYKWDITMTSDTLIFTGIEGMYFSHSFDKYRRITDETEATYDPQTTKYSYKSDAEPFPCKKVTTSYWEEGGTEYTYEYEYMETDAKGNWTKRKVTETEKTITYEYVGNEEKMKETVAPAKTYIETAMITYY